METAAHILASLVCTKCEQLLKRGPVYQQHDGAAVCGSCQALEDAQPASRCLLYEATAQLVRFPCRYRDAGCTAIIPFVPATYTDFTHEDACEYRQYVCPLLGSNHCDWTGRRNELQQHCQEDHSECILPNPSQITPDIRSSQMTNYIIPAFDFLFLLQTRVCVSTAKLHYAVRLLGDPQEASNFSFTVTIRRGKDIITRIRDVLPEELLVLQEHSALSLSINGLLSVLDGWDGASLSVEVIVREPQAEPEERQRAHITQAEPEREQGIYETLAEPEQLQGTQITQAELEQGQGAHGTQAEPELVQGIQVTQAELEQGQGAHGTQAESEVQGAHMTQAELERGQGSYETLAEPEQLQGTQVTQAELEQGQGTHGTQAEPEQGLARQLRQAEAEQVKCGKCRRPTPRLYRNCGNWLCRGCAPGTMKCSSEGCGFQDIDVKLWIKHDRWFCERRTSCWLCHSSRHPDTPWQQHYTTCRKVDLVDSSFCVRGKGYYLVETAAGDVLFWCECRPDKFFLHVFSPVPCEQLHLYRCEVRLACAGNTRTHTPDTKYNKWWDWEVECYYDKFFSDYEDVHVHLEITRWNEHVLQ